MKATHPIIRRLALLAAAGSLVAGGIHAAADTLYVANYGNSSVIKIGSNGNKTVFVNSGLSGPTGLAFDREGNLYVADSGHNRIMKYDPQGGATVFATNGFNYPAGIAFDQEGNLYVANGNDDTIMKVATNGTSSLFADSTKGLNSPWGLVFGPDGTLYVGNVYNIQKIAPDGSSRSLAGLWYSYGLAFYDGALFCATSAYGGGEVMVVAPDTGAAVMWAAADTPTGLAFDQGGNLFIACGDNTIQKSVGGGITTTFASGLSSPAFIAFKPPPILHVRGQTNGVVLSWNDSSFTLQAAPTPSGTFTNVPGTSSPWTNTTAGLAAFFRLKGN